MNNNNVIRVYKSPEDPRSDAEMAEDDRNWYRFYESAKKRGTKSEPQVNKEV